MAGRPGEVGVNTKGDDTVLHGSSPSCRHRILRVGKPETLRKARDQIAECYRLMRRRSREGMERGSAGVVVRPKELC